MTEYKDFNFGGKTNPMGNFGPLIGLVLFLFVMYFLITGLFSVLAWASPVLLIGAAIFDHTVITDYGKFIFRLLKENPLLGLIAVLFTVVGYPAVFGYLFFKALARRKIKQVVNKVEKERNTYSDYEEVKTAPQEKEDDFMILPNVEKPVEVKNNTSAEEKKSGYDDLFK